MKTIINTSRKGFVLFIIFYLPFTIFLSSCGSKNTENKEAVNEHHEEHENINTTILSAEQIKSIGVKFGVIEKKQLTASLKANGLLKVPNQNKATATSLYGGVVKSILVQPGNKVRKGQTLATISNPLFITMQEEFLNSEAKTNLATLEYNRQKTLNEGNAAALKNYEQAETELKILKAKKASLQKQLALIGIKTANLTSENMQSVVSVKSPIAGSVSNVMVNMGSYTEANNPVAEIVDNSQLHLDLYVYEKDLSKLKVGQTIHFTLTNNAGKEYDAKVFGISNTFEPNTKAIAVHALVQGNKTNLIDGMGITALVSLENALLDAVPTSAIVNFQNQDYIFIVNENAKNSTTTFEKIPIRKGTTDIGYSEITLLKEIPADAKIVTNGAFFILAKMTNKGEAHEH